MYSDMVKETIETLITLYVFGAFAIVCLLWWVISSAVKHGVKKALEEFYNSEQDSNNETEEKPRKRHIIEVNLFGEDEEQ